LITSILFWSIDSRKKIQQFWDCGFPPVISCVFKVVFFFTDFSYFPRLSGHFK